jgi:hypothetical protein
MSGVIVPQEAYLENLIRNRLEEAENRLKGSLLSKDKIELTGGGEIVFDGGGTKITSTEVELPEHGKIRFGKFEIYVEGEETLIFQHGEKKFIVGLEKEVKDDKDKEKEKEKEKEDEKVEGRIEEDNN